VTGSLLTSFSRLRRAWSRIIHKNESAVIVSVNFKSVRPCSFPQMLRRHHQPRRPQFCAGK
jgi:hypothetical protein